MFEVVVADQSLLPSLTSVATSQRPLGVHSLGSLAQSDAKLVATLPTSPTKKTHHMLNHLVMIDS